MHFYHIALKRSPKQSSNMVYTSTIDDCSRYRLALHTFNWLSKDNQDLDLLDATTRFKEMIPVWLNEQFSFKEWEHSFVKSANGIITPGYIVALQRVIATRADCLVLVGGGKFQ